MDVRDGGRRRQLLAGGRERVEQAQEVGAAARRKVRVRERARRVARGDELLGVRGRDRGGGAVGMLPTAPLERKDDDGRITCL
jgi:hypothetical protein